MSDTNIHALPIGHSVDGYRILRLLGAGGFGITYLAEEIQIGRKVAIKEYLPQGFAARAADSATVRPVSAASKEQFAWGLDRFRKEAATLVAFEHPNIVSVFRYFEANATAYLVMQYVEGKPLDALVGGGKKLEETEIEEVILPILGGLEQVHAAHFLHRDIKPANIYIRKDGRPVLLDFGAARQAFGSETKSITAIVSEGYAPFEQYEAKGDQGPWTDVYALGAVLYRCITGERPPAAPERVSARLRGAPDPMPSARAAGAGRYSQRLLDATDRALSTMPADRPQSIGALRALLMEGAGANGAEPASRDAAATGMATAVHTISTGAAKPKSRVPLMAGIAGAVVAAGVAAYFALVSKPAGPSTAATPGVPPTTVSSATPATPPQPSAEELAERAAKEAEAKAEADIAAIKERIVRGDLVRARDDARALVARIDEALARRPRHAGLERVRTIANEAGEEAVFKIAERVKTLIEDAEREATTNYAEAQRLVAEAERLDPAAGKAARERIEAIARSAEAGKERQERIARHVKLADYHFDQARTAVRDGRLAEARSLGEQARLQLDRAMEVLAADPKTKPGSVAMPPSIKDLRGEVEAFQRDLAKRIAARMAVLMREARELTGSGKLDDAAKRLDEAGELEPASADLAAARRALDEARKKPQTLPDPDAAERERTKNLVPESNYDPRARRGSAYFAFGSTDLTPTALAVLARSAAAAKTDAISYVALGCSYDQFEATDAAQGRALAQARCDKALQAMTDSGLARARTRVAIHPAGKGPSFRRVFMIVLPEKAPEKPTETTKPPEPQAKPGAYQLAGRTARISRIAAQRRAVLRIELRFEPGGGLGVSCSAEGADGAQSACFGQRTGRGRWTLNGSTLCLSSPVVDLPNNGCYELSGSGNQLRLTGAGILAGAMLLQ